MTRVKICGNKTLSDASLAVEAGADAVGVLVGQEHRSDDFVDVSTARDIFAALPPFVAGVLVTHRLEPERVVELVHDTGCSTLQLHAEIDAVVARRIRELIAPVKLLALVSVRDDSALQRARMLAESVDAILLDSVDDAEGRVGGTGRTHDWRVSARIAREIHRPVVLAGGLDPSNVADAVRMVRPWAVDANSALRGVDGGRSAEKLRAFLAAVHDC